MTEEENGSRPLWPEAGSRPPSELLKNSEAVVSGTTANRQLARSSWGGLGHL
jgi:hypothetical protein